MGNGVFYAVLAKELYNKNNSSACYLLHSGFLLGLVFDPEDEGDVFPRNFR
jgi:hypothetical protein